ncbi:MAG TPA: hypothetical protein ENF78_01500 [Candidatus Bathyarchaeota archaeon]|nr:hypothetical protein [Candidatus Bathyarchaeota archaeon]
MGVVRVHFKADYALAFGEKYELKIGGRATLREVFERLCQELGKKFKLGVYDPEKRQLMGVVVKIGLNSKKAVEDLDVLVDDDDDIVIFPMDLGG